MSEQVNLYRLLADLLYPHPNAIGHEVVLQDRSVRSTGTLHRAVPCNKPAANDAST